MSVVTCEGVVRRFRDLAAVDEVSFRVEEGEIFGLIGPNGAGKTTLLNCIEGLDRPTSGRISVLGLDPIRDRHALTLRTGVQLQSAALPPRITVAEAMRLFSALYEGPAPWWELLTTLGIAGKQKTRVDRLSGGERQRLFIALALLHEPEVVFLDELTTALDPQARLAMWDVVASIRDRGTTVVLTTHYMEEAEHLCDRVGIIDHGRLVALDTVPALIRDHAGDATARLSFTEPVPAGLDLELIETVTAVQPDGKQLIVQGVGGFIQDVMNQLTTWGVRIADLRVTSPGLEDVFLNLTGRAMRAGEAA
ncbi:ABC-type multidrug transport system, ATPase component [Saccharomonospora marina XMU15]|uniref:ABC-type multidrug transport system, ATPase component n=1 Tax=Saccharomonospora marina XMU15 TaxID=882083 RepID=H5WXJ7_9PSEU|nr:ABC transporter ATP-binding protein [Saccharomonospora marina]EHR50600.1 ABC-type multidrug transport system, ATPase component [Saccharomonospora marina XMU15]